MNRNSGPPSQARRGVSSFAVESLDLFTQLVGLVGVALIWPLLQVLRANTPFLFSHGASALDLVVVISVLLVVPAGLVVVAFRLLAAFPRLRNALVLVVVGTLAALWASQILRWIELQPIASRWILVGRHDYLFPLAAGVFFVLIYLQWSQMRGVPRWLALPAVVFPLWAFSTQPLRVLFEAAEPSSTAAVPTAVTTPVFLIVLDELPMVSLLDAGGEIDSDLFPNFAELAGDSLWFPNAITVAQRTRFAVPAILTGRYPFGAGDRQGASTQLDSLFTRLGPHYTLNVFEATSRLCRLRECSQDGRQRIASWADFITDLALIWARTVSPPSLAKHLPTMQHGWAGFGGERKRDWQPIAAWAADTATPLRFGWREPVGTFKKMLRSLDRYPRRTLHYLHLMLPHYPWRYHPDGHAVERTSGALRGEIWVGSKWQRAQELQAHLLQLGFVDSLLGALIQRLESLGLYRPGLLIVTSDHGASFQPGSSRRYFGVQHGDRRSIANVPLFLKLPFERQRGVDTRLAETVDILPTILEVLQVPGDHGSEGISLLTSDPNRRVARITSRTHRSRVPQVFELAAEDFAWPPPVVALRESLFPWEGWAGVFAMGAFGHLVGSSPDHPNLVSADEEVEWTDVERLATIDFSRERLPGWIEGKLVPAAEECRWLAVVLNGRVEAVTLTRRQADAEIFQALIDPRMLRSSGNELAVRWVDPGRARPESAAQSWCEPEQGGRQSP